MRSFERIGTGLMVGLAVAIACAPWQAAIAQDPEFRAMWVTRFEWPNAD
jgi:hypothetical protein